jgi:hypothetical protein
MKTTKQTIEEGLAADPDDQCDNRLDVEELLRVWKQERISNFESANPKMVVSYTTNFIVGTICLFKYYKWEDR